MKRLRRWLFNLAAGVSLVLGIAIVVLWIRNPRPNEADNFHVGLKVWTDSHTYLHRDCLLRFTNHKLILAVGLNRFDLDFPKEIGGGIGDPGGVEEFRAQNPNPRAWEVHARRISAPPGVFADIMPHSAWGFGYEHESRSSRGRTDISHLWSLPLALPLVLSLILPILWLSGRVRTRSRIRRGACPVCGYDLRATPDRCPECGRVTKKETT
jgi:4-amino-4-deoxy-L-arabinose transferase-like glycosyltransferase